MERVLLNRKDVSSPEVLVFYSMRFFGIKGAYLQNLFLSIYAGN